MSVQLPIAFIAFWLASAITAVAQDFRPVDHFPGVAPEVVELAKQTLVIFNPNDRESEGLARFYAEKRGIPPQQVMELPCAAQEEISREEFDTRIADPLRASFFKNGWWKAAGEQSKAGPVSASRIRFVVMMRGMPLKIAASNTPPDPAVKEMPQLAQHNEASVDSELAALGFGPHPISGVLVNPYFGGQTRIDDAHCPALTLVCRLDAPTAAIVRQMILDALEAEKSGLDGFAYVDARGIKDPGYIQGDQWLFNTAIDARRRGIPVILDQGPGLFPDAYPMRHAAFYFGWYAEHASGAVKQAGFQFEHGAVAVHIHSFSAATLRDPNLNWCGPLLAAGAACTVGSVYEPYLDLTPHLDIFFDRLLAGFTFAEASYMSEKGLSWMTTFLGDPLYRPFSPLRAPSKGAAEWSIFRTASAKWFQNRAAAEAALKDAAKARQSGVIYEGLGLLELSVDGNKEAYDAFEQARRCYKKPDDVLRVAINEIGVLHVLNRAADAIALVRKEAQAFPKNRALEVLDMIEPAAVDPGKKVK